MTENKKTIKLNKEQTISLYRGKEKELGAISNKLKEIDSLFAEISKAENTLKEIKNIKESEKILMNIGAGILVDCEVKNVKEVKISLPGTIMVTKDIASVLADIENRKKELSDVKQKLSQNYNNNVRTLQQISLALEKMQKQNMSDSEKNNVS